MDFKPPTQFSASNVADWPLWKQKFEIYMIATEKSKCSEQVKIATLLACIGDEGIHLYNTLGDDKKSTLEKLLQEFDIHYVPKKVVAMETFTFNNMVQEEGKNIDQYLTDLRKQAQLCDFVCKNDACKRAYDERMIRDRMIIGLSDKESQLRLLREKDLTVDKIVEYCKSIELSKQHLKVLNPEENTYAVRSSSKIKCKFCLYEHFKGKCPAFNKTCANCQQKGHFAKACYKQGTPKEQDAEINSRGKQEICSSTDWKQNQEVGKTGNRRNRSMNISCLEQNKQGPQELESDDILESAVYISECKSGNKSSWYQTLSVEGKNVIFKLDSGSDSSILPKSIYDALPVKPVLRNCPITLVSYGNFKFKPLGEAVLKCSVNSLHFNIKFIIVNFCVDALLGLDDCLKFNLIMRINTVISCLPNTKDKVYAQFKDIFEGLGKIPGKCTIELAENAQPVIQYQRKVPLSLHESLKKSLDNLESKNVIEKVTYPTQWVNSLMIVEKPDKTLRLCIDPKPLNKFILREHFLIPTTNDIISKLSGKSVFSVIDMKDGFWQLELDKKSSDLCVFNTPFGRYKFNRLPFGISSSPELFQRKNFEIFGDIKGLNIYFDDMILASENQVEHDKALFEIFKRARVNNIKFNFNKFQYKLSSVKFMGLIISKEGIHPDEGNIEAVTAIETPKNKTEVLRVLGLVKFFSKFVPNLSRLTENLRNLTRKNKKFEWTEIHENELVTLKYLVSHSPTLKLFNPNLEITIQSDASSEGLGCVLLQEGYPISFASRTLSKSEKGYAQIEKELLSICFAFEKFHYFVYGHPVTVQSDHKPLGPIFSKQLDKVSNRLQRMLLKLLKYDIKVVYLPGKDMLIADLLSRSYIRDKVKDDPEMEYVIHSLSNNIAMSDEKKEIFKRAIDDDPVLSQVKHFCQQTWPNNNKNLDASVKFYFNLRSKIYLSNNLLFLDNKIIVPTCLRQEMLTLVHKPHFGIQKTKLRARQLFYWPLLNNDIEEFLSKCESCQLNQRMNPKETLVSHTLPNRPWQYVFADFFEYNSKNYLLFVDAYSNWIEVTQTKTKTVDDVIKMCDQKFSQFGIPDIFYGDNVPFNSHKFKKFAFEWNFELKFSSPHHHQSNGLAERSVGIVKDMLRKSRDVNELNELLLEYHNTPLPAMSYSPAELFLGRTLKTKIPVSVENLKQKLINHHDVESKLKQKQDKQKLFYDKTAKDLKRFQIGDTVLFQKGSSWEKGKVVDICNDRSYIICDQNRKEFHRNRRFLKETKLEFAFKPALNYNNYKSVYDFSLKGSGFDSCFESTEIQALPPINENNSGILENSSIVPDNNSIVSDNSDNVFDSYEINIERLFENSNNNIEIIYQESVPSTQNDCSSYNDFSDKNNETDLSLSPNGNVNKRNRKPPLYLSDYKTVFTDSDS